MNTTVICPGVIKEERINADYGFILWRKSYQRERRHPFSMPTLPIKIFAAFYDENNTLMDEQPITRCLQYVSDTTPVLGFFVPYNAAYHHVECTHYEACLACVETVTPYFGNVAVWQIIINEKGR